MNFLEDSFDLEVFRNEMCQSRAARYREKNAKLLKLVTFVIAVVSFAVAFVLYDFISYSIEMLRFLA